MTRAHFHAMLLRFRDMKPKTARFCIAATVCFFVVTVLVVGGQNVWSDERDPRLQAAERLNSQIRQTTEKITEDVTAVLARIDAGIKRLPDGTLNAEQQTLDGLREGSRLLHGLATEVLRQHDTIVTDLGTLQTLMAKAVPAYQEAARLFREYAEAETYQDIKTDYETMAKSWTDLAERAKTRATNLAYENQEIRQTMQYVARTAVFLERLQEHLDAFPDMREVEEREQYLERLREYVVCFEQFRKVIGQLNQALQAEDLTPEVSQTAPATSEEGKVKPSQDEPRTSPSSNDADSAARDRLRAGRASASACEG